MLTRGHVQGTNLLIRHFRHMPIDGILYLTALLFHRLNTSPDYAEPLMDILISISRTRINKHILVLQKRSDEIFDLGDKRLRGREDVGEHAL
jgi:hypothetical protein